MHDIIAKKVKEYNPEEKVNSKSEYTTTEKMSLFEMIKRYANGSDKCMISVGILASMFFGLAAPGFSLMFGHMIDEVGAQADNMAMKNNTYMMICVGLFIGFNCML